LKKKRKGKKEMGKENKKESRIKIKNYKKISFERLVELSF